jgi:hypothetical protein
MNVSENHHATGGGLVDFGRRPQSILRDLMTAPNVRGCCRWSSVPLRRYAPPPPNPSGHGEAKHRAFCKRRGLASPMSGGLGEVDRAVFGARRRGRRSPACVAPTQLFHRLHGLEDQRRGRAFLVALLVELRLHHAVRTDHENHRVGHALKALLAVHVGVAQSVGVDHF